MNRYHKPTRLPNEVFEYLQGGQDPAELTRIAHETARALLVRVRDNPEPAVLEKLVRFTDEHGIDAIAELWARSSAASLPGALWRIYLLRAVVQQDPRTASLLFQRGVDTARGIDPLVAGAEAPTGPDQIRELADRILRGLFEGDFAVALERAAAFCRVSAAGATDVADDLEATEPERASELTTRALRFATTSDELLACARLWRRDSLE